MEIIVGYLFGVLYYKRMLCVLIRITSLSAYSICLQDKRSNLPQFFTVICLQQAHIFICRLKIT